MQPKYSSAAQTRYGGSIMRRIIFILLMSLVTTRLLAGEKPVAEDELTTFKREYADVLALQRTPEDVVYEFDASGLIAAGLDPSRLQHLPEQGRMTPGVWYFLPKGQQDPHHGHAMASPTIAIAVNIK